MKITKNNLSFLNSISAADIMSSPVLTVRTTDTIREVSKTFIDNNISSLPVVDPKGYPVGVMTKADTARYDQERISVFIKEKPSHQNANLPNGFHIEPEEETVERWFTPFIFDVFTTTPVKLVVEIMLQYGLHHVFVRDRKKEYIVGVISTFDLLKLLSKNSSFPSSPPLSLDKRNTAKMNRLA